MFLSMPLLKIVNYAVNHPILVIYCAESVKEIGMLKPQRGVYSVPYLMILMIPYLIKSKSLKEMYLPVLFSKITKNYQKSTSSYTQSRIHQRNRQFRTPAWCIFTAVYRD